MMHPETGLAARQVDPIALGLVILAVAAPVLVVMDVSPLLRVPVALLLVCIAPGLALLRMGNGSDALTTGVHAVALTFAVDIAVAMPLLYLKIWSPLRCLVVLAAIVVAATIFRVIPRRAT